MVALLVIKNDNNIETFTRKCLRQNDDATNRTARLSNKRIAYEAGVYYDGWLRSSRFVFDTFEPFLQEVANMSKLHGPRPIQNVMLLIDTHCLFGMIGWVWA
jgi:hypothetical protein